MHYLQKLAQDFSPSSLEEIASAAHQRAQIIISVRRLPWDRTDEERDAIEAFQNLAISCRKVIEMGKVKTSA